LNTPLKKDEVIVAERLKHLRVDSSLHQPATTSKKLDGFPPAAAVRHTGSKDDQVYTYRIPEYKIEARMIIRKGYHIVKNGSKASSHMDDSMAEEHRRKRQQLITRRQLVREVKSDLHVSTSDVLFDNPSEASGGDLGFQYGRVGMLWDTALIYLNQILSSEPDNSKRMDNGESFCVKAASHNR
jgi:hypothetical protein